MALIIASIKVPMHVYLNGKKYHLNLNNYRNWNRFLSNNLKKAYAFSILPDVMKLPKIDCQVKEHIKVFKNSKRRYDLDNIIVLAKFLNDALMKYNVLDDDDSHHVASIELEHGGYVKGESYAIVNFIKYVPET